jgi:hypothetical protein
MKGMNRTAMVLVASGLAVSACVGGSKDGPAPKPDESLKAFILDAPPADVGKPLGIDFDGKVTLLGAKVSPEGPLKPGQRVKVTMYWKSNKPLEKGWKLFTHVLDGSGERILNIDNVGPIRRLSKGTQALAPSAWEPGKVYVDEQSFTLPRKLKTTTAQFTVGIWRGRDRLPTLSGPHDRQNRGIVAELTTTVSETPKGTEVPELRVDRLEPGQKIVIDGKLDEPAWATAATTGPFVDVRTGRPNKTFPVNGSAKVLWDNDALYVAFEVKDEDVIGGFDPKEKDPHLWTRDAVEIMIDPDGDGDNKDYYEIQINPQNLVFDSQFDTYNQPRKQPDGPFGHQEWSSNLTSAVTVMGTLDQSDDKDEGYVIEAKIPWKAFTKAKQSPPKVGDTWRINFYAMQQNGGVAWSPILGQGNFHRASRFGRVLWAEKGWEPEVPEPGEIAAEGAPSDEGKADKAKADKAKADKADKGKAAEGASSDEGKADKAPPGVKKPSGLKR